MSRLDLVVVGSGLCGPLGLTPAQVALAARGQLLEPVASSVRCADGEPVAVALSRWLPRELEGEARLEALAWPALRCALDGEPEAPVCLVLAAAPGLDALALMSRLCARLGRALRPTSALVTGGRVAFARALVRARDLLASGESTVVVGAVDSSWDSGVLAALGRAGRVRGIEHDEERLPGEGAAFIQLRLARAGRQQMRIVRVELGQEQGVGGGGAGRLARRVKGALGTGRIEEVVPDIDGSSARQAAFDADRKVAELALRGAVVDTTARTIGDAGIAQGAVQLVRVHALWREGVTTVGSSCHLLRDDTEGGVAAIGLELPPRRRRAAQARRLPERAAAPSPLVEAFFARIVRSGLEDLGSFALLEEPGASAALAVRRARVLDALYAFATAGPRDLCAPDLWAIVESYCAEARGPDRAREAVRRLLEEWVAPPPRASSPTLRSSSDPR